VEETGRPGENQAHKELIHYSRSRPYME
jgi:hypothetical protein